MSLLLKSTWTILFDLLQKHLQSWLDDLQMPAELSHNVLQGILQNHMLKVEVLSAKIVRALLLFILHKELEVIKYDFSTTAEITENESIFFDRKI